LFNTKTTRKYQKANITQLKAEINTKLSNYVYKSKTGMTNNISNTQKAHYLLMTLKKKDVRKMLFKSATASK
jgi:hypothetical protein